MGKRVVVCTGPVITMLAVDTKIASFRTTALANETAVSNGGKTFTVRTF